MPKVIYNMSASLDGFVRARGYSDAMPLGEGGELLHKWYFERDAGNLEFIEGILNSLGAIVTGRTTYDHSKWSADGPTGALRIPTVVLTHDEPASPPADNVFTFVTSGIADAIAAARAAAGGKNVSVMGGPDIGQQALAAGLVDEIIVSIVPILFGSGLPMFAALPRPIELERVSALSSDAVTHLTYRVYNP